MGNESLWPSYFRCGKRHEGRCLMVDRVTFVVVRVSI